MRLCRDCAARYGFPAQAALKHIEYGPVKQCDHPYHAQPPV